ncbi:choice-of-anchor L domain-containing protein, partial [Winogradskyella tangerina]|uniref:choice-of-anchor L domain-containing protein n=1 Tax=Winogradskyella tangerina TaxID=2023240 RepID=UPI000DF1F6E1
MKKIFFATALIISTLGFSQDISMENGTFNRCEPDRFFDSGGEFGNYANDENLVTTICPQNAGDFIILEFTEFTTQQGLNADVMNIYDGDDTSAALIGTFQGPVGAFTISATEVFNTTGCLTVEFISSDSGSTSGWAANILCAAPCQDIMASIDSTVPATNNSGVISILPGDTVDFTGSATFSLDGSNATYNWDFGDTNTASGTNVSNTFTNPGTYTVTLTVSDDNPQGCSDTETITVFVLGANVVVDQDTYTPQQLIEDVLINSPCATVSNVISSTGINFSPTEPNGIGYFISNGIDFPFEDGIILTSGDASQARGPNDQNLSTGSIGLWPGDNDLNTNLGVNSNNASFIQFDFTPLADNISFDFLMASEEYDMGSFECNFSDAFAFLLTDSMGNTTNLAVLPGTNTPILVTNIHPFNGFCPAVNEQFFGGYTPFNSPPTAFDGRTAVFTAQANVVPGEQYTIKLVIADDGDAAQDSGVFLRAGSFDLGGDLGEDITIEAGTAECDGTDIELNTSVDSATHTWFFEGVEIPGETGSTITVSETGTYSVDIVFAGICAASDSIFVEFRPSPTAGMPEDLFACDVGGGTATFDLRQNDDDILGTQDPTEFVISYHLTEQDAMNNLAPLPDNYVNTVNPQIIWARMADNSQGCSDVVSFTITASSQSVINPVNDIVVCDDISNDGFEEFDLSTQTFGILGAQSDTEFNITYHLSAADASAGTGALPLLFTNVDSPIEEIFVRIENIADPNCFEASPDPVFSLIIDPQDIATFTLTPSCDGGTATVTGTAGGVFAFSPDPMDGSVIDAATGEVTGAQPGVSYTISYTTTGACPASSTEVLDVLPLDDPGFTMTATCDGGTATITGDAGGTFAFNPVPADAAVIDAATGTVTGGVSGTTYTIEYTTSGPCPQTSTQDVTVIDADDAGFTVTPTCDGGTVTITGTPGGTFTFGVAPTDAAVIDPVTGDVTGGTPGASYTISYTTSGVCSATESLDFNALPIDDASFTVEPTCDGGLVTLTGTPGGVFSFNPLPGDGATIDPNTGDVTGGTPGASYTIEYVTTGVCPNSSQVEFTVNPLPVVVVPFALEVCDDGIPDGITAIDLSLKNSEISGGNP